MQTTTGETPTYNYSRKPTTTTTTGATTQTRKKENPLPTFTTTTINASFVDAEKNVANKKNLFGDLITQGDLTILFGRSNVGKSFLGYQIAQAIADGLNVLNVLTPLQPSDTTTKYYNLNNDTQAQKVVYFDFEGTKEKNYMRYSTKDTRKACTFSQNLFVSYPDILSVLDPLLFVDAMEAQTIAIGAKVVIIDNLSAISQDNEKSGNAVKLMNKIKDFQRRNNLTIILMAHTPKIIEGQPIIWTNLAGSSNLFNLADSVMAVNTTNQDTSIRYIKQLKSRYNEIIYNEDNVITMKFCLRADGFKGYDFLAYESEHELIKVIEKSVKDEENDDIINLVTRFGSSYMEMAKELQPKYAPYVNIKTYKEKLVKRVKALKDKGLISDTSEPLKPATTQPAKPEPQQPAKKRISEALRPVTITTHESTPAISTLLNNPILERQREREKAENEMEYQELQKELQEMNNNKQ
jgi:archaellum biogenesis ATPase FlaH